MELGHQFNMDNVGEDILTSGSVTPVSPRSKYPRVDCRGELRRTTLPGGMQIPRAGSSSVRQRQMQFNMLPCFASSISNPFAPPKAHQLSTFICQPGCQRQKPLTGFRAQRVVVSRGVISCCGSSVAPSITPAIVVVDHGSKREAANKTLNDVISIVRRRSSSVPIYGAHMELASPTISDAFRTAVERGANHIIVVPFFLAPGRHVSSDIPALVSHAAQSHPGVTFDVRSPIGTHPAIADLVMERAGVVMRE
jgi:sirohydrochlorin ferrochelatase